MALLVTLKPGIVTVMPAWLQIIFGSGVTIGSLTAIILNLLFFHIGRAASPDVGHRGRQEDQPGQRERDGSRDLRVDVLPDVHDADMAGGARLGCPPLWVSVRPSFILRERRAGGNATGGRRLIASYSDIVSLVLDGQGDEQSLADTANLSVGDLTDKEAEELRALASAYREKFGRPLVICVDNVVDRKHLLESGWRRVEHSPAREARFSLGEVIDIATCASISWSPTRTPCAPRGTRGLSASRVVRPISDEAGARWAFS